MIAAARFTFASRLKREPDIGEQRIIIVRRCSVSIELVVVGVLQSDAHISPRPHWRPTVNERNVGNLEDVAVAIRTTCTSRITAVQLRDLTNPTC